MEAFEALVLNVTIQLSALLIGALLGSLLADVRSRRRELLRRIERLEETVKAMSSERRSTQWWRVA